MGCIIEDLPKPVKNARVSQNSDNFCVADALPSAVLSDNLIKAVMVKNIDTT
jgi:hypothetical protein